MSDRIFEIPQLWQSGFRRVYSNCCCSYSFEPEIIKIGLSSHKMHRNNILNFQESMTILNAHKKKVWKLIVCTLYVHTRICIHIYMHIYYVNICTCISILVNIPMFTQVYLYINVRWTWYFVNCYKSKAKLLWHSPMDYYT